MRKNVDPSKASPNPADDSLFTKSNQRYLRHQPSAENRERQTSSNDDEVLHSEEILVLHKKKVSQRRDSFDDLPLEFIPKGDQQQNQNFESEEPQEPNLGDD